MCPPDQNVAAPAAGAAFAATPWTVVLAARSDDETRRQAMEQLCRIYWLPIYHFVRRRGQSPHDAEDLTQGFFAYVVSSDFLERPDPARGRFRGYLVGALKRYLAEQFKHAGAQKRGGGAHFIEWDSPTAEQRLAELGEAIADPVDAYERSWALTLIARALDRLAAEQRAAGRERLFLLLKPQLTELALPGEYARLAAELGITRAAVALAVHRLKQRHAELVRLEVAATVADPTEVKAEMEHLARALRS